MVLFSHSGLASIWWTGCECIEAGGCLVEVGFKVHRGLVAEGAVEPLPVVKDFDPLENRRARLGARGEVNARHQFPFQTVSKALHGGVVVAVATSHHFLA